MSVHTLSRIHMARGALAQAAKDFTLRRNGSARVRLRDVIDLLKKELSDQHGGARRKPKRVR